MRAAIYNPYLDTLGGGERYTVSFAKALSEHGYEVYLQWKNKKIKDDIEKRFGINMANINIISDVNKGDNYDLCFWVSDGSIPTLHARVNLLHFQVPFHNVNGRSLLNKMKLFRINKIICNSNFTKKVIDKEFGVNSIVIYPPVSVEDIKPKRKENIILSVSRFSQLKQSKHQDILIEVFKNLVDAGLSGWKFILAGGSEIGADEYLKELEKLSNGYPIEIIKSPDFKTLKSLYGISKIFWSAAGYEENEIIAPEKVEHFGITIVEAMSAGCVPIIFNAGGHKEIIENNKNGFLWKEKSELTEITTKVINDQKLLRNISLNSISGSSKYSYKNFKNGIIKLL